MFIRIETSSGVPISRQIADQIRNYTASGTLAPGDRLPSVRQLAKELLVNQNTILHVYERLTDEGILERRQGDGTFVSTNLPRGRIKAQRDLLAQGFDQIAQRAKELGVTPEEAHKLMDESFARLSRERNTVRKGQSHE